MEEITVKEVVYKDNNLELVKDGDDYHVKVFSLDDGGCRVYSDVLVSSKEISLSPDGEKVKAIAKLDAHNIIIKVSN